MTDPTLVAGLQAAGLVTSTSARMTPLTGGVSSDILLVEDGDQRFVVKRALAKLRVRDDWFADVSRNQVEQQYLSYAGKIAPGAVPRILHADEAGWFAMEYCGDGWKNWKSELLAGRFDPTCACRAGDTLGRLHAASWNDAIARAQFDTLENFTALRIEPYLLTTAARVTPVRNELLAAAEGLAATRLALVHGDFSPKNLLVASGRLLVLDAEVAWFGDPAFDVAFLVNHLLLKALVHAEQPAPCLALIGDAWSAYVAAAGSHADAELQQRIVTLTLCLMLARVHGKSPVEYLTMDFQKHCVTEFVIRRLPEPPPTLSALVAAWADALRALSRS